MCSATTQDAFADALLHRSRPVPPGVTTSRGEVDPLRFAVYRNNVFVSLTKALAQRFPVTERIVGADFFAGMARAFAQDHKPSTPLIMNYGDAFPGFIRGFDPAAGLKYLPDLARLEAAWTQAYHAADAVPLDPAALASATGDLAALKLVAHPSAFLIRSAHPIGSIWAAHQEENVTPLDHRRPETVLVVRPAMAVGVHILPVPDGPFAEALFAGAPLGAAATMAMHEDERFDFGAALVGLVGLGAFAALSLDEGTRS